MTNPANANGFYSMLSCNGRAAWTYALMAIAKDGLAENGYIGKLKPPLG
jgi:hypothetical protein